MLHRYQIDLTKRVVRQEFKGTFDLEQGIAALKTVAADPLYNPELHTLTDLRNVELDVAPSDVLELSRVLGEVFPAHNRRAAIVVQTPRESALALLHAMRSSSGRILRVFTTMAAAEAWLFDDVDTSSEPGP